MTKREQNDLHTWCLEQASARYMGILGQDEIDRLTSLDFPWAHFENELDKLGYSWEKNNPDGKRYNEIKE